MKRISSTVPLLVPKHSSLASIPDSLDGGTRVKGRLRRPLRGFALDASRPRLSGLGIEAKGGEGETRRLDASDREVPACRFLEEGVPYLREHLRPRAGAAPQRGKHQD